MRSSDLTLLRDALSTRRARAGTLAILAIASLAFPEGRLGAQTPAPASSQSQAETEWAELSDREAEADLHGEYGKGVELAKRALAMAEAAFGRDHPHTLYSLSVLAELYRSQGRYAEAEPLLLRALEARERTLGRDHPDTIASVLGLASEKLMQGRYAEAEPLYLRALASAENVLGPKHRFTLWAVSGLASLYSGQGRYAEAEPLYLRALETRVRTLGREHPFTLQSVIALASLYTTQGRYAEAEPLDLRALEAFERTLGRDHPDTLRTANNLAWLYEDQGRYAEAGPLYLRALDARERTLGRDHPDTLVSVHNLAWFYHAQGLYTEAEPLYRRALEAKQRTLGRDHPSTLATVWALAELYRSQGRYAEAEPLYLRALDARERALGRDNPATIAMAVGLATERLQSATPASAIEPARLAIAGLRARRAAAASGAFAEEQRGREERQSGNNFSLLADAAWASAGSGDRTPLAAESLTALEDATAGTTNRAVIEMAVRHVADAANAGLGALVRERQGLNDQWAANNRNYGAALAASGVDAEALRTSLRAARTQIETRMDAIDAILRRDFPQYFALVRPEALDLAATRAMLAPDEAILMVVPTQFGTHLMAIDHDGIDWVRSDWTQDEVNGAVGQLLGNIRTTLANRGYTYDRQTAFALYQHIVAPVGARLAGKRHVFVVASGALSGLPFGILVTEAPQGANDDPAALRDTHWFADAHALTAIPSIQSLQFLRRYGGQGGSQAGRGSGFVGFGNPVLDGPAGHPEMCTQRGGPDGQNVASVASGRQTRSGGMLASVSLIRTLCPLPGTAAELEHMRTAFHAPETAVYSGARSTEHDIRTIDLSGARILVLATHGLVAGELSGSSEPGLVFTPPATATEADDGFLTASEVATLRLDADWVILSACNTAAGDGSAGAPGLSGLARAFFYAGARTLLASHWPVVDEAGERLTVRTIQLRQEHPGYSRAEALQRAMQEVRNDPNHPEWAHPGVWAPFSLIGDGAH